MYMASFRFAGCPEVGAQPIPPRSSPQKSPPHQTQQTLQNVCEVYLPYMNVS